jgi:hypothetical protein
MDAWVAHALSLVPKGDYSQSRLRNYLNMSLRNALGPDPEHPEWTVKQVVMADVAKVGGQSKYDPALLALDWPLDR